MVVDIDVDVSSTVSTHCLSLSSYLLVVTPRPSSYFLSLSLLVLKKLARLDQDNRREQANSLL